MSFLTELLLQFEAWGGNTAFLILSALSGLVLCFHSIPWTTDLMVNNSAGLVGKYVGRRYRTLVINASTNNPEAANMLVSFSLGVMGGWANPLGSLLANFYLMYLVAPIFLATTWLLRGHTQKVREALTLAWQERRLVLWHLSLGAFTLAAGWLTLGLLRGRYATRAFDATTPQTGGFLWAGLGLLIVALWVFHLFDRRLQKRRPELFEDIAEEDHGESWWKLAVGTVGLIACSWLINALFQAWSELYRDSLERWLGNDVFLNLHYFVGALLTSLPELHVAWKNFSRLTRPDLHTALGSATYSNFTNLFLALLGLLVFAALAAGGIVLPWE